MEKSEIINYWLNTSDNDFITMEHLFLTKDFCWCLFIGHLVIEKLLKAGYVKNIDDNIPFTHDLLRLASRAKLI
jgi:HEPN domain-containing protein